MRMTNYEKYTAIFESINDRFNAGELSEHDAETLNDMAYEKYMSESKKDDILDMIDCIRKKIEDDDLKLDDEQLDMLKDLCGCEKDDDDDDKDDDKEDDDNDDDKKEDKTPDDQPAESEEDDAKEE